ncbi:phenylacetate--CoA ligase family protein [Thermodesulfobacteriota bacterium]
MEKGTEPIYWEKEVETLPRKDLEALQLKRLRDTFSRTRQVPYYKEKCASLSINPDDIRSLEDIRKLPFTIKDDLRAQYPYGALAVPLTDCVRFHSSSGTTGSAVAVLCTKKDIETWADMMARSLFSVGARESDIFQNMAGYGLFSGGLGFHYGAERMGLLTIPVGTGNSKRQVELMTKLGTTVVHFMPSYGIYLMNVFMEMGVDPKKDACLKFIIIGAENSSEETRQRLEGFYGVDTFDSYGLSEVAGPGVSFQCHMKDGLHVWEDHYILEILEPGGDNPVPDGEVGEVVFTTLMREAMPLIRYRTRDLASIIPEPCKCGRTHRRISRIKGRIDDMIIYKGVNIYPVQIEKAIMAFPEVGETYLIILETRDNKAWMTIQVEVSEDLINGDSVKLEDLRKRIGDSLQSELLVSPGVKLVPRGTIEVSEAGKAKRVIDKRTL